MRVLCYRTTKYTHSRSPGTYIIGRFFYGMNGARNLIGFDARLDARVCVRARALLGNQTEYSGDLSAVSELDHPLIGVWLGGVRAVTMIDQSNWFRVLVDYVA